MQNRINWKAYQLACFPDKIVYSCANNALLSCADPESFTRGNATFLFFFFLIRGKRIQVAHKASHPWPASEMAFRWRADDGPTLNAGLAAM